MQMGAGHLCFGGLDVWFLPQFRSGRAKRDNIHYLCLDIIRESLVGKEHTQQKNGQKTRGQQEQTAIPFAVWLQWIDVTSSFVYFEPIVNEITLARTIKVAIANTKRCPEMMQSGGPIAAPLV